MTLAMVNVIFDSTDPDRLARTGVVSRVHARRFGWTWAAARLVAVYQDLIGRSPA